MIRSHFDELRARRAQKLGVRKLSLRDVAANTGLSMGTMQRLSAGDFTAITTNTLDALCAYFECQPSDLLEYVPDPKTPQPSAIGEETTPSNAPDTAAP